MELDTKTGVYGEWAPEYFDAGYSVLPVHPRSKRCTLKKWTEKFSYTMPTLDEQESYQELYSSYGIGLACGKASGVIAIDFDLEGPESKIIEKLIISVLPTSKCIKVGKKGWTRFYKYNESIVNKGINRLGVRAVDILTTGKLTVMPPSTHPNEPKGYRWITPDKLTDLDSTDLNDISLTDIDNIVDICEYDQSFINSTDLTTKKSRHDAIVGFILKKSDVLESKKQLIKETMEFDDEYNGDDPKGPYFKDEKYLGGSTPIKRAADLVDRVCKWKKTKRARAGINWTIGKYSRDKVGEHDPSSDYKKFKDFFESVLPDAVKCTINKTAFKPCKYSSNWIPVENSIKTLESLATDYSLKAHFTSRHLSRWIDGLEPKLRIRVPELKDEFSNDPIGEMVNRLLVTNVAHKYATELFKEWGANVFRRLYSTGETLEQNKMIILKGGQGIGKDSFIHHFCKGFGVYYSNIPVSERAKDNYERVSDLLIANIPEFDETRKMSIAVLKDLITSHGARFRAAYAAKAQYVPFYTSYISSCNFDNILRDSSGNRRFIVLNVDAISWDYASIDPMQIVAQCHHLYKKGFRASKEATDAMDSFVRSETPKSTDEMIVEMATKILTDMDRMKSGGYGALASDPEWYTFAEIMMEMIPTMKRAIGVGQNTILGAMKRGGLSRVVRNQAGGRDEITTFYGIGLLNKQNTVN